MKSIIIDQTFLHFPEEDGEIFIPIKRLCQAFSIDYKIESDLITNHPMMEETTSYKWVDQGDGTRLKEWCIPFKWTLGWLGCFMENPLSHQNQYKKEALEFICDFIHKDDDQILKKLSHTGREAKFI